MFTFTCVSCHSVVERQHEPHHRRPLNPAWQFERPDSTVLCRACYQREYHERAKAYVAPLNQASAKRHYETHKDERREYNREYRRAWRARQAA